MANESEAKVIPLHKNSGSARRHPSTVSRRMGRVSTDHSAAVRDIDEHRGDPEGSPAADATPGEFARAVTAAAAFLRERITGDYQVDEFGFDPHFNEAIALPLLRFFFNDWFRVEVSGIENLPVDGPALLVANHAGVLPMDALMLSVAVRDHHPAQRNLRMLAADLVFDLPVIGPAARKAGHTVACNADANRLLAAGELTAVFPEGYKGLGKRFKDRYKLQRFGRGGFVSAALRTKAPIVPCSIVGSEEIYPMLADVKLLARLLGVPYFPITPLFPLAGPAGLVPLPSKWHIAFGEPIETADYEPGAAEDPMVTFELTDQVRETIQQTLYRLLAARRNVFLG
ncbi:lysophospholipid acyltransferase family protein [Mycolicibacter sp. MYC123]|uniref:Lysophospholipid acyltransferase family protein n=1 Tax=[Mycobacterium] zoologicum TaxID=2872311 RepID=A0ABU5YRK6_9MYCO|nr:MULTISPECIES: lysophospholipid acyltransferase family protein [unclassified Mycolicibacter]MEB3051383.1 lysophospholipid acyltransferase family protein [Mycolicibacter sp. MYC123]MEB3065173.1 lysophospholipid acyltransferase family protein [Mycolicibacter sp. MYC101]